MAGSGALLHQSPSSIITAVLKNYALSINEEITATFGLPSV